MSSLALYIKDKRVKLYPDENVTLNRSVQSLKDLTKVFTDFTQSFKVPADDINNAILKHWYDAQIINGFDGRIKHDARIEVGGVVLKKGQVQLNDATLKDNEPVNYSLQFFGDTIRIKDLIGDDKLKDLDLSIYDHDYNANNIRTGLDTGLFGRVIKYPLLSYKRRYLWQDAQQDDDQNINIKYDGAFTSGLSWRELKPAIKCDTILDAIQTQYGLTFSNDFFNRREWNELYMTLGNGQDEINPLEAIEYENYNINVYQRPNTFNRFIPVMRATVQATDNNINYRVVFLINGQRVLESPLGSGTRDFEYIGPLTEYGIFDFTYVIESEAANTYALESEYFSLVSFGTTYDYRNTTNTIAIDNPQVVISELMPDIKVQDWLKGIIKAHNLVLEPQEDNSIIVNDLNSWYNSGDIIDVTQYVDISTTKVERGKLYREIDFVYEDQESILANQYESQFGKQFGGVENTLTGIASEDKIEFKVPFENPQFERLQPVNTQYGFIVDKDRGTYKNKPFLLYIHRIRLDEDLGFSGDTYAPLKYAGLPSHAIDFDSGFSAQFDAEYNEQSYALSSDNWYSRYYADYFNDLFNQQRRQITVNANLPITIASKLRLRDRLLIKGQRYIIDNLDSNLITGITKLVLLNDIFSNTINEGSYLSRDYDTFETEGSVYYSGSEFAIVTTDSDWILLDKPTVSSGELITFSLEANDTGVNRIGQIFIQDNLSNPTYLVIQNAETVTFDSKVIKWDNTNIKF